MLNKRISDELGSFPKRVKRNDDGTDRGIEDLDVVVEQDDGHHRQDRGADAEGSDNSHGADCEGADHSRGADDDRTNPSHGPDAEGVNPSSGADPPRVAVAEGSDPFRGADAYGVDLEEVAPALQQPVEVNLMGPVRNWLCCIECNNIIDGQFKVCHRGHVACRKCAHAKCPDCHVKYVGEDYEVVSKLLELVKKYDGRAPH